MGQQLSRIIQDMQTPNKRTPVHEGGSGLHYSGQVYANQFNKLATNTCPDVTIKPEQIKDIFPGPAISTVLPIEEETKRIKPNALTSWIKTQTSAGVIPGNDISPYNKQIKADMDFYASAQSEYCFYESRYKAALGQFLEMVSQQSGPDPAADKMLKETVTLNQRLNCLLEVMNWVANDRAQHVDKRSPTLETANESLQDKIKQLGEQQISLTARNAQTTTQEEMVRYSAEKSHAMNIQIVFFVALNVVALGTILTVYKNTRPGGGA